MVSENYALMLSCGIAIVRLQAIYGVLSEWLLTTPSVIDRLDHFVCRPLRLRNIAFCRLLVDRCVWADCRRCRMYHCMHQHTVCLSIHGKKSLALKTIRKKPLTLDQTRIDTCAGSDQRTLCHGRNIETHFSGSDTVVDCVGWVYCDDSCAGMQMVSLNSPRPKLTSCLKRLVYLDIHTRYPARICHPAISISYIQWNVPEFTCYCCGHG